MKNKKGTIQFLLIGFFLVSIFFGVSSFSDTVLAQDAASSAAAEAGVRNGDSVLEDDGVFTTGAKYLLYAILVILIKFVQVAASVFTWATQPAYISGDTGLLNLDSVYTLWKFIRDFFNLFFIFLLLFSAFATVFQIEQYGIKKNFLKIIAAAIAINFSFPLTRIIIDLGNVPMYFFAQGLTSLSGNGNALQGIPQAFFQSSGITEIGLLPNPSANGTLIPLLTGVIFMFIFMITLFVLALLFVMRLLTLVVLLIFSPLGVAASIVPGLAKYGKDWWSSLLKNVFFGPAAMLMVVIALRFTLELNGGAANTGTTFTQGLGGTAPAANAPSQSSVIAQGVFFIPIVLMWMAMHAGSKFGIVGASEVMKRADKVAAWGKNQATFGKGSWTRKGVASAPGAAQVRGIGAGLKSRYDDKIGKPLKDRRELGEARGKALATGLLTREKGSLAKQREKAELQLLDKRAREQEKKWKDDGKTASDVLKELNSDKNYRITKDKDGKEINRIPKAEALAAANFLSGEKEFIDNPKELARALSVASKAKKQDLFKKLIENADGDALEIEKEQLSTLVEQETASRYQFDKMKTAEENAENELKIKKKVQGKFKDKMKKEGKATYYLDYKVEEQRQELGVDESETVMRPIRMNVYKEEKVFSMNAKDIAKNKNLLSDPIFQEEVRSKWGRKQVNAVEKFLIEDGGDEEAIQIVESIKESVEAREGKKSK